MSQRRKSRANKKLRARLFKQFFPGLEVGSCCYCGKPITAENSTLEHKKPIFLGGEHKEENFALSCPKCNHDRGGLLGNLINRLYADKSTGRHVFPDKETVIKQLEGCLSGL